MPNNYVLLERTELNASAASVTFANIPQTGYTDLKIVISSRSTGGGSAWSDIIIKPNNSTTGISTRVLYGTGSAAASTTFTTGIPAVGEGTTGTANTFGNAEIYISNYTSANNKSFSADSVSENNATSSLAQLGAMLWSNTAAITSLVFTDFNSGNFVSGSTFSLYGLAALGTTPAIAPKASGGNIIDFDGTYWIHTFLTSGTFTPQVGLTCDYLVVAGGGAGNGLEANGGGGGGGYRTSAGTSGGGSSAESALILNVGTNYTVTIGAGGTGAKGQDGTNGSNSVFSTITSTGGGSTGQTGGGGGGASWNGSAGSGTANQGFGGGSGFSGTIEQRSGGGGGGAGVVGSNAAANVSGNGGDGVASSISGTSVTRGGGGGGGQGNTGTAGTGGSGGGGNGQLGLGGVGAGTVNTGGGGGGGGGYSGVDVGTGGSGGSGIVIIRYPAA